MQRGSAIARQVLRWSAFLAFPGILWGALEMYGFTLSGPQMLFFSIAHTMPLLVLAIWLAMPTGAFWLAQSVVALAWPKYRSLVSVSAVSAATFIFALVSQAVLLATYEEWSSSEVARTPLCLLGLVTTVLLVRESWRTLRHSAPFNPPAPASSDA